MEDEEFNLDEYRKAWQAESRRLEASAPRHSEEDILAMLQRHNKPSASSRRPVYLWVGRAAAGVALLIGIAWLLLRQSQPTLSPDNSMAQLPQEPATIVTPPDTLTPSTPIVPPTLTSHSSTLSASLHTPVTPNRPTSALLAKTIASTMVDEPVIASERIADTQPSVAPTINPTLATAKANTIDPDMQAFHGQKQGDIIDHSSTWKSQPDNRARRHAGSNISWRSSRSFASSELSLSLGTSIESPNSTLTSNPLLPAVSLSFSLYSKTEGRICAFSQFGATTLFDQNTNYFQLHFSYGLAYRPVESLTLGLNMGAYLMTSPFDLGLLFNAQASYRIAENFSLGLSYRYCTTGIFYESRQMAFATISYLFE